MSTIRHCINQVCTKDPRGSQVKGEELGDKMKQFADSKFCTIYPQMLDMCGRSMLKQIVAQQILDNILVDMKTRFEFRLRKVVFSLLRDKCPEFASLDSISVRNKSIKRRAYQVADAIMRQDFDSIPVEIREEIWSTLPSHVEKSTRYDLMKSPGKFVGVMMKLVREEDEVCFIPTRTSNIPCHTKLDTECVAQVFLSRSNCTAARRNSTSRTMYNEWVL